MSQVIEKVAPKVGDVFYTSWGYDQTNVEFYKVVRVSKASVWVQETGQVIEHVEWGNGDYWKTSSNGQPLVREFRDYDSGEIKKSIAPITCHRIRYDYEGLPAISMNSYKSGYFWDGKPKQASTGH